MQNEPAAGLRVQNPGVPLFSSQPELESSYVWREDVESDAGQHDPGPEPAPETHTLPAPGQRGRALIPSRRTAPISRYAIDR